MDDSKTVRRLAAGVIACIVSWVIIEKTTWGFAARISGGNVRAALIQGLAVGPLIVGFTALAGAFAIGSYGVSRFDPAISKFFQRPAQWWRTTRHARERSFGRNPRPGI